MIYLITKAAYELANALEAAGENEMVFLASSHDYNKENGNWYVVGPGKANHHFKDADAGWLLTQISKHLNTQMHRFDGCNYNVQVERVRLGDLLAILPTTANQRRRKFILLLDD